jgi:hypothetical protein
VILCLWNNFTATFLFERNTVTSVSCFVSYNVLWCEKRQPFHSDNERIPGTTDDNVTVINPVQFEVF